MVDRTKNRSDHYQHLILESSCSSEMLADFAETDSIYSKLNPFGYNEELLELKDQLKVELWRVINTQLTARQKEVITLYAQGLTQIEIAKRLNVNQSSVTKSLHGNIDYRNGRRVYGGAKKKLKRIADKDEVIQGILKRIAELQSDGTY